MIVEHEALKLWLGSFSTLLQDQPAAATGITADPVGACTFFQALSTRGLKWDIRTAVSQKGSHSFVTVTVLTDNLLNFFCEGSGAE